jgi:hypothetical protein
MPGFADTFQGRLDGTRLFPRSSKFGRVGRKNRPPPGGKSGTLLLRLAWQARGELPCERPAKRSKTVPVLPCQRVALRRLMVLQLTGRSCYVWHGKPEGNCPASGQRNVARPSRSCPVKESPFVGSWSTVAPRRKTHDFPFPWVETHGYVRASIRDATWCH